MKNYQAFLLLTIALIITYGAVWMVPYLFMDDYSMYVYKLNNAINESVKPVTTAVGRPLHALALYLGLTPLSGFEDLRILRFISVIAIAVTSWIVYLLLTKRNWSTVSALGVAYIVGTLPTFEVQASWAIAFVFPFACALAGSSVLVIESKMKSYIKYPVSVILLIAAFSIHQPDATIYWAFVAIPIFMDDVKSKIKQFIAYIGVFFFAAVASLIVQKISILVIGEKYVSGRTEFVHDIPEKIKWFFTKPFVNSTNFHYLHSSVNMTVIVTLIILVGLYLHFTQKRWTMLIIATLMIPFSYSINLIVSENWSSYRTQAGISSLMLIYLAFAVKAIADRLLKDAMIRKKLLVCSVVVSSLWAIYNVTIGFVMPQYVEFATIRFQVDQDKLPTTKKIYVIGSHWSQGTAPFGAYDEFGYPTAAATWSASAAVKIIAAKIDPKYLSIPVEVVDKPEKIVSTEDAMVIDTRKNEGIRKLYYK